MWQELEEGGDVPDLRSGALTEKVLRLTAATYLLKSYQILNGSSAACPLALRVNAYMTEHDGRIPRWLQQASREELYKLAATM